MTIDDRTCLMCGQPLPEWSSRSRRYCDECGRKRNIELTWARQRKREKVQREAAEIRQAAADRKYCQKCLYAHAGKYPTHLCDYILLTGNRRGCKAGVGCTERRLA